ncbi:hypothetical protein AAZV13_19G114000 [Glycine max]
MTMMYTSTRKNELRRCPPRISVTTLVLSSRMTFLINLRMRMRNLMLKVRMMITRMKMLLVTILERKMMEGTQGCYKQLLACQVRLFKKLFEVCSCNGVIESKCLRR